MNKVYLIGNLTRDPEMRSTNTGIPVCNFSIAVNRRFTRNAAQQNETDFFNVTAWRQTADFVSKYFRKGSMIAVQGSLQSRSYEDKNENKPWVLSMEAILDFANTVELEAVKPLLDSQIEMNTAIAREGLSNVYVRGVLLYAL